MFSVKNANDFENLGVRLGCELRHQERVRMGINGRSDRSAEALDLKLEREILEAYLWMARRFASGTSIPVADVRDATARIMSAEIIPQEEEQNV